MKHLLAATALTAGLALTALPASALPSLTPADTINIVGSATFTSTQIHFTSPAGMVAGTGAFAAMGTCLTCVTVNPTTLTYSPFTAAADLFTATNAGLTATVSITGQNLAPSIVGNDLDLNDFATLTLTGFAPTSGTLELSVNEATGGISGSFSATGQPVPEPGTVGLLGVGLLGLGTLVEMRRRRRR